MGISATLSYLLCVMQSLKLRLPPDRIRWSAAPVQTVAFMSDTSPIPNAGSGPNGGTVRFAIIGCGYVADFYMQTIANYPHVEVVRAFDIEPAHAARYTAYWKVPGVTTAEAFFDGLEADVILNLTNPDSHYPVSKDCLERGFNVYSEKPLAMKIDEVFALRDLATARGLSLGSAPCNHLSEAVAGIRETLETGSIGTPLLVYAEMDDGFIAKSPYKKWTNLSGAPWPYEDEFEVGCSIEHAGYYLTWLIALFGSVREVHAFSSLRYPGKPVGHKPEAADFSETGLAFARAWGFEGVAEDAAALAARDDVDVV
jgi:predicted dehydrogenase